MTKIIRAAPREVLLTRDYLFSLAKALGALGPRRQIIAWIETTLFRADEDGWIFMTGEGHRIFIGEDIIEETFGADLDFTSVSDLKRKATNPPRRNPRSGTLRRLQIYDLVMALAGRPVRAVDRWIEAQRMRKLLGGFNPVRRAHYVKAVRDVKRRMKGTPNPVLYSQKIRELRLKLAAE